MLRSRAEEGLGLDGFLNSPTNPRIIKLVLKGHHSCIGRDGKKCVQSGSISVLVKE